MKVEPLRGVYLAEQELHRDPLKHQADLRMLDLLSTFKKESHPHQSAIQDQHNQTDLILRYQSQIH
tara:strand:- start:315 stop:512 length:198 start_codon:yes stop_codon:yes gene_type:complete